jgi:hypothetical protein
MCAYIRITNLSDPKFSHITLSFLFSPNLFIFKLELHVIKAIHIIPMHNTTCDILPPFLNYYYRLFFSYVKSLVLFKILVKMQNFISQFNFL